LRHTVYSRALLRAAEILGGNDALAAHLGVTPMQLSLWMNSHEVPPQHIFLKAVDVLAESNLTELREANRSRDPA
jgi:DNA-binding transcriptional regulator YdaS (Cro superfamily)